MSKTLHIDLVDTTLFFTRDWVLQASVDGKKLYESCQFGSRPFVWTVRQWARACIRKNQDELRNLEVNVEKAYKNWGGLVTDLYRKF